MPDYNEGLKKDVVEIKFLIHDLRVERFINEVIHFHVTLNTDLELYGVEQAQILHGHDLQVLKEKAVSLRKAYHDYSNAVNNFSPDRTVLLTGRNYVDTIYRACELILSPLWGRVDKVLTFLPPDSRSAKARTHYLNCTHWIRGVYHRIQQFADEQNNKDMRQEFDIAAEIEDFTRDVAYGYIMEHSGGRVQVELDRLDPAIIWGNLPRFRRMYFNLVMNAADAMSNRDVGVLTVGDTVEGDSVILRVRDNGSGMTPEKIKQLLTDRDTLDGELHSLGFVFVRQTVKEFNGDLSIESEIGKGTTLTIRFTQVPGKQPARGRMPAGTGEYRVPKPVGPSWVWPAVHDVSSAPMQAAGGDLAPVAVEEVRLPAPAQEGQQPAAKDKLYGNIILADYQKSDAEYPGVIFAMSVSEEGEVDYFLHAPYEKYWNITHQDLSPMLANATVRGRLEEDDEKRPSVILKAPQSIAEYFDFKNVPSQEQTPDHYADLVRDEYIRIARTLIETGMSPEMGVLLDRISAIFRNEPDIAKTEPFSLGMLAARRQIIE